MGPKGCEGPRRQDCHSQLHLNSLEHKCRPELPGLTALVDLQCPLVPGGGGSGAEVPRGDGCLGSLVTGAPCSGFLSQITSVKAQALFPAHLGKRRRPGPGTSPSRKAPVSWPHLTSLPLKSQMGRGGSDSTRLCPETPRRLELQLSLQQCQTADGPPGTQAPSATIRALTLRTGPFPRRGICWGLQRPQPQGSSPGSLTRALTPWMRVPPLA